MRTIYPQSRFIFCSGRGLQRREAGRSQALIAHSYFELGPQSLLVMVTLALI